MKLIFKALPLISLICSSMASASVFLDTDSQPRASINSGSTQCRGTILYANYNQSQKFHPHNMRRIQLYLVLNTDQDPNSCSFTPGGTNNQEKRIFLTFDDFGTPDFNLGSTFLGMTGKQVVISAVDGMTLDQSSVQVVIAVPPPPNTLSSVK